MHGGAAPQNRKAGARRVARAEAETEVQRLVQRREISSAEALAESLHRSAALVEHYGNIVASSADDAALTQYTEAGRRASVWVELYGEERDRLANYAGLCVKLGLEERQVQIAERQGELLAAVVRDVTGWLLDRWRSGAELPSVEAELPQVVRRHLLAMASIETTGGAA